jgi:hypothetical protein
VKPVTPATGHAYHTQNPEFVAAMRNKSPGKGVKYRGIG